VVTDKTIKKKRPRKPAPPLNIPLPFEQAVKGIMAVRFKKKKKR
jgi:hypothetical protein